MRKKLKVKKVKNLTSFRNKQIRFTQILTCNFSVKNFKIVK